jgi:ADP-heptose:LPS heptosyltransferase
MVVVHRVCFIPPRFVGDCLYLVPLLRQLKQAWGQQVEIGLWLPPIAIPLFEGCPYVDWVAPATKQSAALRHQLKTHQVETVILTRHSAREALVAKQAGVRNVIGFQSQRLTKKLFLHWGLGLTTAIPHPVLTNESHQQQYLWQLLAPLQLPVLDTTDTALELWLTATEKTTLQTTLTAQYALQSPTAETPWIVIHWASASQHKDIALHTLTAGLLALVAQYPNVQFVFTGLTAHIPQYEAFLAEAPPALKTHPHGVPRSINLAGKTTLRELAILLSLSRGLIGLDSAPLHLASAVGVPSIVGVYGAVSPVQWHPPLVNKQRDIPPIKFEAVSLTLPCKPCIAKTCETDLCRTDILPSHLLVAVNRVF